MAENSGFYEWHASCEVIDATTFIFVLEAPVRNIMSRMSRVVLKRILFALCLSAMIDLVGARANATLFGSAITATGSGLSPTTATIGLTPEFEFGNFDILDFDGSSLTISDTRPYDPYHGGIAEAYCYEKNVDGDWERADCHWTFTGFIPQIISVIKVEQSNLFCCDSISWTDHSIAIDFFYFRSETGGKVVLKIDAVPEPSTFAFLALGVLTIVGFARRRSGSNQLSRHSPDEPRFRAKL